MNSDKCKYGGVMTCEVLSLKSKHSFYEPYYGIVDTSTVQSNIQTVWKVYKAKATGAMFIQIYRYVKLESVCNIKMHYKGLCK